MNDRLAEICAAKRIEVAERKRARPSIADAALLAASAPRGFEAALRAEAATGRIALIAEIKRASPSKGLIRADFDPRAHARAYAASGATCLSVLTDTQFFGGSTDDLIAAREACDLPVLRKDFIVDVWQVDEARAMGADAILIIVAALDNDTMRIVERRARELAMDVLVEVHDADELRRASDHLHSRLIGVNNRDLRTFTTDLSVTEQLAPFMPPGTLLISESGIDGPDALARLRTAGAGGMLVGELLMRHDDVSAATRHLLSGQTQGTVVGA